MYFNILLVRKYNNHLIKDWPGQISVNFQKNSDGYENEEKSHTM